MRHLHNRFIGEETYSAGASRDYLATADQPATWCVDPLDGTVNYTHLFPMFCVSIAFLVHGRPVVGVVHAPFLGQLFSARRGRGAWLNGTQRLPLLSPPQPIPPQAPKGCVFSCEWGKDRRDPDQAGGSSNLGRKVESFVNMAVEVGGRGGKGGMVHGVRSLGRCVSFFLPSTGTPTRKQKRKADHKSPPPPSPRPPTVRHSTWPTSPWAPSTYGGRAAAGSGTWPPVSPSSKRPAGWSRRPTRPPTPRPPPSPRCGWGVGCTLPSGMYMYCPDDDDKPLS